MASAIRTIGHEDRLSLVDHLDELRTRLIVSAMALAIAFGICLWQNHALLHLINKPLKADRETGRQGQRNARPDRCSPAGGAENRARHAGGARALSARGSGLSAARARSSRR
jgi:sec-independent protein translocase protein TatC